MSKPAKIVSLLLIAAVLLLLVFLPKYFSGLPSRTDITEWLKPKTEPFRGTVSVWHVVGVRPYLGSLGRWLKDCASTLEKRHFGVYFDVETLTEEEASARIASAEFPDVVSFPGGFIPQSMLAPLPETAAAERNGEAALALPYAAACRLILYYPDKVTADELLSDPALAADGTLEAFKKRKACACTVLLREAGDMERLLAANKTPYFEVLPFETETAAVQFIGVSGTAAPEKLQYIEELTALIAGKKRQQTLTELGLMPVDPEARLDFEPQFLTEAYTMIREGGGIIAEPFSRRDGS